MIKEFLDNKISSYSTQKTDIGIGGFNLGVTINESLDLSSQIATSYVESGDYVNDHIVNTPLTLSISGEAGDIHLKQSQAFSDYKKTAATVGRMTPYFPKRTATQISRVFGFINTVNDTITKIDGYIEDGVGLYDLYTGKIKDKKLTPQEEFVEFFTMVYENRLYINVEAFGKVFENMGIQSLSIRRENNTFVGYSFTFMQLRFASTTAVKVKKGKGLKSGKKKGANKSQMAVKKSNGTVEPKKAPEKDTSALMGGFRTIRDFF